MMRLRSLPVQRLGRFDPGEEECCLWWAGSGIRMRLACSYLYLEAEADWTDQAVWIGVMADGAPVARFPLQRGRHVFPLLEGMDPDVSHEIMVLRDTQPCGDQPVPVILHALDTDGTPEMPACRKRLVEFIGDSLTVGEGCIGPRNAADWRMAWMSHMSSYPCLVSEQVQADSRVIAVSGWGVWKSWDSDPLHRLGAVYDKLCPVISCGDVPYAFRERPADAVVINLGTNDYSALSREQDRPDAERQMTVRAEEMIALVRARQPDAPILWAYGLCGNGAERLLRLAVDRVRAAGDEKVIYLPLDSCGADLGSLNHPGREAHRRAALQIVRALRHLWGTDGSSDG